jgi:hypothetical protein
MMKHLQSPTTMTTYPNVTYRRRPQKPDILLAKDPPRILGLGIVATAILLGVFIALLRSIEYQDTVPIVLTLRTDPLHQHLYGEGYVQLRDMDKVRIDQAVLIDALQRQGFRDGGLELKVNKISMVCGGAQYIIKVDIPPGFAPLPGNAIALPKESQLNGRIIVRTHSMYDKLFKGLSASLGQS